MEPNNNNRRHTTIEHKFKPLDRSWREKGGDRHRRRPLRAGLARRSLHSTPSIRLQMWPGHLTTIVFCCILLHSHERAVHVSLCLTSSTDRLHIQVAIFG